MFSKRSSILDIQREELCREIWTDDHKLRPVIRDFIFASLAGFFEELQLKGYDDFVVDMYIGSSLATYFYTDESDFDIKVVIDIITFKIHNRNFSNITEEDILENLIKKGRKSSWLTAYIPETKHAMDFYFLSVKEAAQPELIKYDSLYNIMQDKWIKEPKRVEGPVSSVYTLNYIRSKARNFLDKLSVDIANAKRDTMDFIILRDQLKNASKEDLEQLKTDLMISLDRINDSISLLSEDTKLVKNLRKNVFDRRTLKTDLERMMNSLNYSDENLLFKLLQRYGYMKILVEISEIYKDKKVDTSEVNRVLRILS